MTRYETRSSNSNGWSHDDPGFGVGWVSDGGLACVLCVLERGAVPVSRRQAFIGMAVSVGAFIVGLIVVRGAA